MTNVCQKAEKNHDFKMASLPEGDGGKSLLSAVLIWALSLSSLLQVKEGLTCAL